MFIEILQGLEELIRLLQKILGKLTEESAVVLNMNDELLTG